MCKCFFASDIHGRVARYRKLLDRLAAERPHALFLGGDLLPMPHDRTWVEDATQADFVHDYLRPKFTSLAETLGAEYPAIFLILGNDDARNQEETIREGAKAGLWTYVHGIAADFGDWRVFGYACVPPTPFRLKDWERYDISRHVDPGCVSPEEGLLTVPRPLRELRFGTIQKDLAKLSADEDMGRAICLFHSPPYGTRLDRAALDRRRVDHVPLDVHIGSLAIRRFIEARQPRLTLHGHVHESTRLTGSWRDHIQDTRCFQGAHDDAELCLIRFDLEDLDSAERELI